MWKMDVEDVQLLVWNDDLYWKLYCVSFSVITIPTSWLDFNPAKGHTQVMVTWLFTTIIGAVKYLAINIFSFGCSVHNVGLAYLLMMDTELFGYVSRLTSITSLGTELERCVVLISNVYHFWWLLYVLHISEEWINILMLLFGRRLSIFLIPAHISMYAVKSCWQMQCWF